MPLLLCNNHSEWSIELTLPHRRGPRQPTTPLRVAHNGATDVMRELPGLTKAQARELVEKSDDYKRFRAKRQVYLVDTDETSRERAQRALSQMADLPADAPNLFVGPPTVMTPEQYNDFLDKVFPERLAVGDSTPEAPPEPVVNPIVERLARRHAREVVDRTKTILDTDPQRPMEELELEATAPALEPGAALPAPGGPSSSWTMEQLLEHAKKKGINTDGLKSRAAVLRKLRP